MNSLSSDARAGGRRPARRVTTVLLALILGVTLALAALVMGWQGQGELGFAALVLTGVGAVALLLCVAALGWHVGVRLTRQQLGDSLREARMQAHVLAQLQPHWQWATDAEHHLVRWQAPQGAIASSWVGATAATQSLWERFEQDGEPGGPDLRTRLEARANFPPLRVRAADGAPGAWLLRGIASFDAMGRFAGYQGTAQPLPPEPEPTPAPEPAPEPAPPAAAAEDHAAFSYTVSHDLRAPLRVVEGFTRILKEDYGRQLDRLGNDHLDRVHAAAARMNGMIDALLSLSSLSARPLECQRVDLSQLAGSVLDELRRSAPERAVEAGVQPGLAVRGDPILLRMVLENLLGNAWKYTARCETARIALEEKEGAFCVSDNGAGFDMRFADRLFGPFQRLHSASEFPGHGVGLASVQRIVRRHGGEIWAESEVGQGARFYFTLSG